MRHRFILLGCGTSTGVPLPGCSCKVCVSQDPKNFRNRTSALLQLASGKNILIDAGPDLRHQALTYGIKHVDTVLYTHAHADHILGTDDLRVFNFLSKKSITCFGSQTTLRQLQASFPYIFNPNPHYKGGMVAQLELLEISNEGSFKIHDTLVEAFPLPHGDVTVTGFRFGELAYATDCKGFSGRARSVLEGVKYLFLDGLRWELHNTHNSIEEAIQLAHEVNAEKTFLIHTTHSIDYEEVSQQLPTGIELGFDGLTIEFAA